MVDNYISSAQKQFQYYKSLGDKTFAQLSEEDLFYQYNPESNSISIIVNHLNGNMLSRWTNFLNSDGEKEWRQREQEFEDLIKTRSQLIEKWEAGWKCLFDALESVNEGNFQDPIYIRNQAHTIAEAINRQMMHYAYHIGQIVYLGRMIKGSEWTSLSIPKGGTAAFNQEKFEKGKHEGHFTDDFR